MKKVSKTYWAIVHEGELVAGAETGPCIGPTKAPLTAALKDLSEANPDVEGLRICKVKLTEVVPKK